MFERSHLQDFFTRVYAERFVFLFSRVAGILFLK